MSKCTACGDKPENTAKDFTKAVIEINNPETLVLLRKVVIPASMGDDTDVVPAVGKYHNVLLHYEANQHNYLYSSDGIPTLLTASIPQEILDRITTLEDDVDSLERADEELQREIDELKNSPDVVDIVATYADLQAYDTSTLGDKDVIRVLEDETHNNESAYYRWDKTNNQWVFIGAVEGYYTKDQTDDLLDAKQDLLTPGENISIEDESGSLVISATDTTYTHFTGATASTDGIQGLVPGPIAGDENKYLKGDGTWGTVQAGPTVVQAPGTSTTSVMSQNATTGMVFADPADRTKVQIGNSTTSGLNSVVIGNNLAATGTRTIAIGDRTDNAVVTASGASGVSIGVNTSSTAGNGVAIGVRTNASGDGAVALGTYATASGQYSFAMHYLAEASGESSVALGMQSVASQQDSIAIGCKADASGLQGIAIGRVTEGSGKWSTCVGVRAKAKGDSSLAVGSDAVSEGGRGTAIGSSAQANVTGSVAIGAHSRATVAGEMNIGSTSTTYGYNSSNYRLLTGLYDGQSAHDAATVGQLNSALDSKQDELTAGTGISITDESGALVISATGASIATINAQDWSALWQ